MNLSKHFPLFIIHMCTSKSTFHQIIKEKLLQFKKDSSPTNFIRNEVGKSNMRAYKRYLNKAQMNEEKKL